MRLKSIAAIHLQHDATMRYIYTLYTKIYTPKLSGTTRADRFAIVVVAKNIDAYRRVLLKKFSDEVFG